MTPWRVPYPKFAGGDGLARVGEVASALGLDLAGFGRAGAVIVGSNGKGSTAAMTAALLRQSGGPVGLFTSPHLLALNERFRLDGADISDAALAHHWARVAEAGQACLAGRGEQLGGFEFLFLIAADWFAARGCAHTVWEAGIGGRLDPVRLIEAGQVALTSLDLEHTQLLGKTLDDIARDKLGAAPRGGRVFVSQSCLGQHDAIAARCAENSQKLTWIGETPEAPLAGAFQRQNAALALALANALAPLSGEQISAGLASTRWPGRLEQICDEPLTVIDVGHTPAAIAAALDGFEAMRGDRAAVLVCGASRDKDGAAIIAALAARFGAIICASAAHKGAEAAEVARWARAVNSGADILAAGNVVEARAMAMARARAMGAAIYVAGGLFLAAEFKAAHLGRDPARLAFF